MMERVDAVRALLRIPRCYDSYAVTRETEVECCEEEDRTQQQFGVEADINTIVRRFGIHDLPASVTREGVYADFSGISGYESALDMVEAVEERFMALPPELREEFGNDPAQLMRASAGLTERGWKELEERARPAKAPDEAAGKPPVAPEAKPEG